MAMLNNQMVVYHSIISSINLVFFNAVHGFSMFYHVLPSTRIPNALTLTQVVFLLEMSKKKESPRTPLWFPMVQSLMVSAECSWDPGIQGSSSIAGSLR